VLAKIDVVDAAAVPTAVDALGIAGARGETRRTALPGSAGFGVAPPL